MYWDLFYGLICGLSWKMLQVHLKRMHHAFITNCLIFCAFTDFLSKYSINYWDWRNEISYYSRITYFIFQFSVFASCIWGFIVRSIYINNCCIFQMCWPSITIKFPSLMLVTLFVLNYILPDSYQLFCYYCLVGIPFSILWVISFYYTCILPQPEICLPQPQPCNTWVQLTLAYRNNKCPRKTRQCKARGEGRAERAPSCALASRMGFVCLKVPWVIASKVGTATLMSSFRQIPLKE